MLLLHVGGQEDRGYRWLRGQGRQLRKWQAGHVGCVCGGQCLNEDPEVWGPPQMSLKNIFSIQFYKVASKLKTLTPCPGSCGQAEAVSRAVWRLT